MGEPGEGGVEREGIWCGRGVGFCDLGGGRGEIRIECVRVAWSEILWVKGVMRI